MSAVDAPGGFSADSIASEASPDDRAMVRPVAGAGQKKGRLAARVLLAGRRLDVAVNLVKGAVRCPGSFLLGLVACFWTFAGSCGAASWCIT